MQTDDAIPAGKPEIILKRVFDAPRELVFKVWTEPQYVEQWWGVEGCTIVGCDLDVRAGGIFRIDMKTDEGTVYVNRGFYIEVIVNKRIVYRDVRESADSPGPLPVGLHTTTFENLEGTTLVTLTSRFDTIVARDLVVKSGVIHGIRQSLSRLERLIGSLGTTTSLQQLILTAKDSQMTQTLSSTSTKDDMAYPLHLLLWSC